MKYDRRKFLAAAALATGAARQAVAAPVKPPRGKAEHVVFLWLGGGMAQIDTFDPKAQGDPKSKPKKAGSAYRSIQTAVKGVQFTEHLEKTAAENSAGAKADRIREKHLGLHKRSGHRSLLRLESVLVTAVTFLVELL